MTKSLLIKKIATFLLVTASLAAFATLGDGGKRGKQKKESPVVLPYSSKNFSLRSNYNYRSNQIFSVPKKDFITLNPMVTYEKGNAAFVMPLKKLPLLGKIKLGFTQSN